MKLVKSLFALALALWLAAHADRCRAADLRDVVNIYGGVNGAWFKGPAIGFPADFELGGHAAVSLSPHISIVGALDYGFSNSYVRWGVGPRFTVTDVDDPNFSVGLGTQFRDASEPEVQPREWVAEASFGWRAIPQTFPRLYIVGQGAYGLKSSQGSALLGVRWKFPL